MYIGRNAVQLFIDEIWRTDICVELTIIYDHLLQIHFPNLECTSDDGTIGNKSKKGGGVFQDKWGCFSLITQSNNVMHPNPCSSAQNKLLSKQMLQKSDFHRTTDISNHNEPSVWSKELLPLQNRFAEKNQFQSVQCLEIFNEYSMLYSFLGNYVWN